ncbi:MAG TPA: phage holin family protein, partial [Planctomycetaceae bacterium]|nr:phage holin family protein [Planctomycetaceae bacterium]
RDVSGFLPPTATNGVTTVYRFLKQPFRLLLDVQKIEPYFSAEPLHVVRLSPGQADWEMTLRLRVYRGSLIELLLPWSTFKAEGWENVSSDTPELVEQVTVEETPNGGALRVRLVDRKARGDGDFELRLKARRVIPTDGTEFELSLPFVSAIGQRASKVIVAPAGNLEVEWAPRDAAVSRPTTPDEEVLDLLESTRSVTAWRWEAGSPMFTAKATVQQQSIRTESLSELTFDARSVGVSQRITYDIGFEPLNQLRLMLPRTIADRARFQLRDGSGGSKPLTPVFTGLEIDQQRQCRLHLEQPQLGKLQVVVDFELNRPADSNSDEPTLLSIPVIQSSDAEFTATRVQWKTGEKHTATLEDVAWKPELPELASDKTSLWKVAGAKNTIAVKISSAAETALQDFTVHRAIIRTVISEGRSHSLALFEIDRDVYELTLFLPPEISTQDFGVWWNQKRIEPTVRRDPTGDVELRLKLPASRDKTKAREASDIGEKTRLPLWLDYYSQLPTHFGWNNQHRLIVPHFAETVWVAQTIWEVVLPSDQHLFTTPRDFAEQFHWTRSLLLWSRVPNFGYDRIERELSNAAPKDDTLTWDSLLTDDTNGNVYPVSCFGPPQTLAFWSMSRSAVVGCGAGLALLLGFLLIRLPATRHVLTFLVVAFAMALAALWFAEPVKVLLQPAILGAVMAVIAAIIDRVGRREPAMPLMTLSSPSDFYAASSANVPSGGMAVNPDAPTIAPQVFLRSDSAPASGSGVRE